MNRPTSLVAATCLAVLSFAFVGGCNQSSLPPGENGNTAGGNGAFGTNPEHNGGYRDRITDNNTPATQPATPSNPY